VIVARLKHIADHSNAWTPTQIEDLKGLAASGVPASVIALHLGRSASAVRAKAAGLGLEISEAGGKKAPPQRISRRPAP
jgi:hypothetical protein